MFEDGIERDGCGAFFTLDGVTGDMGGGDFGELEQFGGDGRFPFPAIHREMGDCPFAYSLKEGTVVGHGATRTVDDQCLGRDVNEVAVDEMDCRVLPTTGEGGVDGDHIGFAAYFRHGDKFNVTGSERVFRVPAAIFLPAGRIACDDIHAEVQGPGGDE